MKKTNKQTQHERILIKLRETKIVPAYSLPLMGILQYNARIKELREKGFDIESVHLKGNTYGFTLHDTLPSLF